jgi:hypothetical protein
MEFYAVVDALPALLLSTKRRNDFSSKILQQAWGVSAITELAKSAFSRTVRVLKCDS